MTPFGHARDRHSAAGAEQPSAGRPAPEFEALFRGEFTAMFRLAHLLGAADPENVTQEAFVRLHERWETLGDRSRAGGYLRTTVVNLCRSAGRRRVVAAAYDARQPDPEPASSAESTALAHVSDAALLDALHALSPRHREALVLRFWLDLSGAQMADAMGCSVDSVKSHVSRGLSALRTVLNSEGDVR